MPVPASRVKGQPITALDLNGIASLANTSETALANVPARQSGSTALAAKVPYVNVKDYGALGNGSADDTAAIQATINAVATTGGTVVFPVGTFMVSATLSVTADGIRIQGAGAGPTILTLTSATGNGFAFGNGTTSQNNLSIRDMLINSNITRTSGAAIDLNNCQSVSVDNVSMTGQFVGIEMRNNTHNVWVDRGYYQSFTASSGIGIEINGGNDQFIRNIVMDNPIGSQPKAGIRIVASGGSATVTDCDFIHCGFGLLVDPSAGVTVQWPFVMNTAFDFCSNAGIALTPSGTGIITGGTFTGCWTSSNVGNGILVGASGGSVTSVDGIRFIGHRSYTNGASGLSILSGTNVRVGDSDFAGNSNPARGATAGIGHGMYVAPGVTNWSVSNSRLGPTGTQGNTQGYGLFIDAGAGDYFTVLGNDLHGNMTGSINNAATGTHLVVANNI